MPTYIGIDVLEVQPNDDGGKQAEYRSSTAMLDSKTGGVAVVDRAGVALVALQRFTWLMDGRAEVQEYLDWIALRQGRLEEFWVPSWRQDVVMAADLVSGTELSIMNTSYTERQFPDPARQHLAFLLADGSKYYRKVTDAESSGDTETLTIDSSIPETVAKTTTMVCFLALCRLAVDDPELVWHTREVAEAVLAFEELPQEVSAIEAEFS